MITLPRATCLPEVFSTTDAFYHVALFEHIDDEGMEEEIDAVFLHHLET